MRHPIQGIRNIVKESFRSLRLRNLKQHRRIHSIKDLESMKCLFVLSTGRCGTKLFTKICRLVPGVWAEHSPKPELAHQSFLAYQLHYDLGCLKSGFLHARLDLLKQVYAAGLCYIETNNRISLYVEAIAKLLPKSKFVHLIRHPGDFVRSGMRRGYYATMIPELSGHLMPNPEDDIFSGWNALSRMEKIAWQWETINREIRRRTAGLDPSRLMMVLAHDLYKKPETVNDIMNFMGMGSLPLATIEKSLIRPVNAQKRGNFPEYSEWADSDKEKIARLTPSAPTYGFKL